MERGGTCCVPPPGREEGEAEASRTTGVSGGIECETGAAPLGLMGGNARLKVWGEGLGAAVDSTGGKELSLLPARARGHPAVPMLCLACAGDGSFALEDWQR